MNYNPIGIFDSGIGGLTVTKEIVKKLPNESIIYLGDTARVPYGTRSKEVIIQFAIQLTKFLLKRKVKFLVIACNTISSVALDKIKKISPVPVIGVIIPAVKKATEVIKNKKIGVIGTQGTIGSKAYEKEIKKIDPKIKVISTACPLFVPLAEEGLGNHEATKLLAEEYLKDIIASGVDTLILGCTHYPLLLETISDIVGPKVTIIDSAQPTATQLQISLEENNLLLSNNKPTLEFFVTDAPDRVYQVAGKFFGSDLKIRKVNL
ncbi:glutamate racemase [Candidatus Daviesbacteria bacterium RIFCSPLOWO2_02_FULL_36_7]|uniref:Glutamate racemase n=1 Tax=Candidatus Daviesbacteria bacterium RIFCSPLOWO2_02_FULL_36_7 TaxID=1797792 RepID=A0A1F5MHW1_9BACT|nr:MAG: glutamate racemase [Candidatus Daviesbacteria bacterium RIFCSPLOWO2_02_FULL_36_7]